MSNESSIFITVTAPKRGDLPGSWTPNRCWPAGVPVTVEVVHTPDGKDPEPFSFVRIGTHTLAQIEAEAEAGRLSYKTAEGPASETDARGRLETDAPAPKAASSGPSSSEERSGPTKRRTFTQPVNK